MLTVALATLVAALVAGGSILPPRPPLAVARVPDEPGATVLPDDIPTLQALAVDLDGDDVRDLVRLVGDDEGPVWVEAWVEDDRSWSLMAPPEPVVPGAAGQGELAYAGRPVRLLLHRVDGRERVAVVRQPDFAEPEDPDDPAGCCLLVDDLAISGDAIALVSVAEPEERADAVYAIDLDGDGTDELLATRSLAPGDDPTIPVEGRVFRWADGRFRSPTSTDLPLASPGTPFVLGDSDGLPGDEVGFISGSGNFHLFRVGLGPGDTLVTEDSGIVVFEALAVPLGSGRKGIAVRNPTVGIGVLSWPRGRPPSGPLATWPVDDGELVGVIALAGQPCLVVNRPERDAVHAFGLPTLDPLPGGPIETGQVAQVLAGSELAPFVGMLPGGGPAGEPAAIVAGRLLPSPYFDRAEAFAALPLAAPIGLVGHGRDTLAIVQGLPGSLPVGGQLKPPVIRSGTAVTLVPFVESASAEGNGGRHEPPTDGSVPLARDVTGVSRDGFTAEVHAPPGSRVYLSGPDADSPGVPLVVDESGALDVGIQPPPEATGDEPATMRMTVATPAGHAYVSAWRLQLVEDAPDLSARSQTRFGSTRVTVTGETAPYATVEVEGRRVRVDEEGRFTASVDLPPWPTEVVVTARDAFGHATNVVVSGIGVFDYRALPWIPIALVLLGAISVAFIARVPRTRARRRPVSDDAALEELDPAERP